jgi:hypothetical protein
MPLTIYQLRQPPTIKAVDRGQYFADKGGLDPNYTKKSCSTLTKINCILAYR